MLEARLEKRLTELVGRIDGHKGFVNDELAKLRRRDKQQDPVGGGASGGREGSSTSDAGSAGDPRAEVLAMRRLGRIEAALPAALRERLDKMLESGAPLAEIASFAEALHLGFAASAQADGASSGGGSPQATPMGAAGSAAPKTSRAYPTSWAEYMTLARAAAKGDKEAIARKAALDGDPLFRADELK